MFKIILLGFFVFTTTLVSAQNNLVIFTLESKPFYVVLNGIRQNYEPETNVKIKDLPGDFYRVKVIFEDSKIKEVDKSISFLEKNQEMSMELKLKRGKFKMRYAGVVDLEDNTTQSKNTSTNNTETTNNAGDTNNYELSNESGTNSHWEVPYHEEEWSEEERESFEINININTPSINTDFESEQSASINDTETPEENTDRTVYYNFMSNGTMCNAPNVDDKAFLEFKYSIEDENMFERQEKVLDFFENHCMLSNQIAGIINIDYSTIDAKMIAKEAYRYTYDTENYYLVLDALSSENDKDRVIQFLGVETSSNPFVHSNNNSNYSGNESDQSNNSNEANENNSIQEDEISYSLIPSYSGYVNCNSGALIDDDRKIVKAVEQESFADDKMNVLKQATKQKCLRVSDVEQLLEEFTHSSDKMEFLKWAWDKTYDIDNFFKLSSSLTFSGDKDALDEFIDEQPTSHFSYVYSTEVTEGTLVDVDDLESRMDEESFADNKMKLVKQALVSRYISVEQIKQLAPQFSHESDLLEFIELSYPRTIDKDEFYTLNEVLTYSSSKDKLNEIIGE